MKNQLSDEVLTDYLFELLDSEKSKKVEVAIQNCPETQKRLNQLRIKFNQLQGLEVDKCIKKRPISYPLLVLAAIIPLAFILRIPETQTTITPLYSKTPPTEKHTNYDNRIIFLEYFSEQKETFSLLTKLEGPLKDTIDLKIPEVRIQYDDENYEIVDLRNYESLNLPSEFIEEHQNNFEQILSLK
ncbi:MAG: hypothetical protein NE328_19855 [Lentisphaeraceae bacterium]|nr:hypothetical protein [Lentisphaeraceae bacterium]